MMLIQDLFLFPAHACVFAAHHEQQINISELHGEKEAFPGRMHHLQTPYSSLATYLLTKVREDEVVGGF